MPLLHALLLIALLQFLGVTLVNLAVYRRPHAAALAGPVNLLEVAVLIPARNEEDNIGACLEGLLAQTHAAFTVTVLDDGSTDGTRRIAAEAAARDPRVRVAEGEPIPAGWAGKAWACDQLGKIGLASGAAWLLFLDADTRAEPDFLRSALASAIQADADFASTFPYQETGGLAEEIVLPMLHFLVITFLPIWLVNRNRSPALVAACGQVELFRAGAYDCLGRHDGVRNSYHDGIVLARRAKTLGMRVHLWDGSRQIRCHMYRGGRAVWNGFTRNAFEALGGVGPLVVMTVVQVGVFLVPWLLLGSALLHPAERRAWGPAAALEVAIIVAIRALQARRFGHWSGVLLHPLAIVAVTAIQWASWLRAVTGRRGVWKGRSC